MLASIDLNGPQMLDCAKESYSNLVFAPSSQAIHERPWSLLMWQRGDWFCQSETHERPRA